MGMVIDCALYEGGRRIATIDLDEAAPQAPGEGRFVWIGLHDLAIEDAHRAHQRAKLEIYGESLFIVLRTVRLEGGKIGFGETHIFAGRGYVVTVRHGSTVAYKEVRARCENSPKMLQRGEDFVVYSVMDFVVDNYFPVLHELEGEVDAIEESVFAPSSGRVDVSRVYELRHELLLMRRAIQPLQEVCTRIMRFDVPMIDADMHPYFRDVQDHIIRVVESIDNLRDLLNSALEANLLLASIHQNDVTKKLAAWAAILAVPTAIAGIYGMNFDYMPELKSPLGYPLVLAAIFILCGWLYLRFKKACWL